MPLSKTFGRTGCSTSVSPKYLSAVFFHNRRCKDDDVVVGSFVMAEVFIFGKIINGRLGGDVRDRKYEYPAFFQNFCYFADTVKGIFLNGAILFSRFERRRLYRMPIFAQAFF